MENHGADGERFPIIVLRNRIRVYYFTLLYSECKERDGNELGQTN